MPPSTFFSSEVLEGYIYGELGSKKTKGFTLARNTAEPTLSVLDWQSDEEIFRLKGNAPLLVQLFEKPEVLWYACAINLQGEPLIMYIPLEPLESIDGTELPRLRTISTELTQKAEAQRDINRSIQRRAQDTN